jgi:hypothetical protein
LKVVFKRFAMTRVLGEKVQGMLVNWAAKHEFGNRQNLA